MDIPKAVTQLEVYRNGELVGHLNRQKRSCLFRYTDAFLESPSEAIALHLPKTKGGVEVSGTVNLPSFFAGLLPEGVMQDALLASYRLSRDDLFSQLALTGFDAVGDIVTRIPGMPSPRGVQNPKEAARQLRRFQATGRLQAMPTMSGVQPKLSVGSSIASLRGHVALVKIESVAFPGILRNEAFFMQLAPEAGVLTAKVKLEDDVLIVTRFDRVKRKDQPPTQIHVEDALQVLDFYPLAKYSLDYVEILDAARGLGVAKSVLLDLVRLHAFSFVIGNGDLHAKNVSFMFHQGRWTLTPAYDVLSTPYLAHPERLALGLDEQFGDFRPDDYRKIGERYALPGPAIDAMLRRIGGAVNPDRLKDAPIGEATRQEILRRARAVHP